MDENEFKLRFTLHRLNQQVKGISSHTALRQAAVLIPLLNIHDQLHFILTRRAYHLRMHPGQISFPGGKIEPNDANPIAAALREANEEIGLAPQNVDILGTFPTHNTLTGFEITPVVGIIKRPFDLKLDPDEVADCFTAPLHFFIDPTHRHKKHVLRHGQYQSVHFTPYQHQLIWGVTAAIIDVLCCHLSTPLINNTPPSASRQSRPSYLTQACYSSPCPSTP